MKICIDFNTEKSKKGANRFGKNCFKLMINSVYGKIMENLRKRISVKVVSNEKYFLKHVSKPTFVSLQKSLIKILLLFMKLNQF